MNWYQILFNDGVSIYSKLLQAEDISAAAMAVKGSNAIQISQLNFTVETKDPTGPCYYCTYSVEGGNPIGIYSFQVDFLSAYDDVSRYGKVISVRQTTLTLDNK